MDRETLVVTGAIIRSKGKVVVARRHDTSRFEPGKWEFPGGKLDFGEDPRDALVREIREELGIVIGIDSLFDVASHVYSDSRGERHVVLVFYLCSILSGTPSPLDCAEIRFATRDEIGSLPFVEGDEGVLRSILEDHALWSV